MSSRIGRHSRRPLVHLGPLADVVQRRELALRVAPRAQPNYRLNAVHPRIHWAGTVGSRKRSAAIRAANPRVGKHFNFRREG